MALYWVRLESENWRDWNDFEAVWRARFGDPDYQYALPDEIFRRTQGEFESAVDYLTCLRALFSRMSPPLAEQLNFTHRNMLPRLQIAIRRTEFADFSTLEYLATRTKFLSRKKLSTSVTAGTIYLSGLSVPRSEGKDQEPGDRRYYRLRKKGQSKA